MDQRQAKKSSVIDTNLMLTAAYVLSALELSKSYSNELESGSCDRIMRDETLSQLVLSVETSNGHIRFREDDRLLMWFADNMHSLHSILLNK